MSDLTAHYGEIRERYGYDPVDVDVGGVPGAHLPRKFAAVDDRAALSAATDRSTLVAMGIGMTGPPHLGTLGQMHNARVLQDAGLDVQFVLADLEPYHGGADLDAVRRLAARYRSLVLELGFDPDQGVLRTQAEATGVMRTAQLLAPYYAPEASDYFPDGEPTAWEDEVATDYDRHGVDPDGTTSEVAGAHSAMLHVADFLHPLYRQGYDQVVIALGIDEHALTIATRVVLTETPLEGSVAGLHSRMVPGVDGHPKMAKSIPGSGIHLAMSPGTVRERIRDATVTDASPATSPVFAMMRLASPYGPAELDRRAAACQAGEEAWTEAVAEYADYIADLAATW